MRVFIIGMRARCWVNGRGTLLFGWIDISDFVIVVITDNTVRRAMAVGQEVGRAVTMKKTVIPLVAEGVPDSALGCLSGVTYSRLTPR